MAAPRDDEQQHYTNARAYARWELRKFKKESDTLDANLQTLRYLDGSGMTNRKKFDIQEDTVYLLIGLGGQGIRKLGAVKRQLYKDCNAENISKNVRFLAIDTDTKQLDENAQFLTTEKCKIYTGTAPTLANSKDQKFLKWIHPQLNEHVTELTNGIGWSDACAQCRQVGRVKLADPNNRDLVKNGVVKAILDMNPGGSKKVRVIIIAGISGGTGGGIIVDVPYMVRSVVNSWFYGIHISPADFALEGYVLLPPACGMEPRTNGAIASNRNAYAALKEIDYFMTMRDMHAADPTARYEFCEITSTDNIFDTCTLVDGLSANGGVVRDPTALADEIVSHTIVTSMVYPTGGSNHFFGGMAFGMPAGGGAVMDPATLAMVARRQLEATNYQQCPREVNYRFLSCGYAEVVIPVDLMQVYVANKVFQRIWDDYNRAFVVNFATAEVFLEQAGLTVRALHNAIKKEVLSGNRLPERTQNYLDQQFKQKGPYYMTNMLRCIADMMTNEYIEQQHPGNGIGGTWGDAKAALKHYRDILLRQQLQDYMVYTTVIEQLQKILSNDANILTSTQRLKGTFSETFCWEPIDLSFSYEGQKAIKEYLDNLLDERELQDFALQFQDDLVNRRDMWVGLFDRESKFDAASEVRNFIEDKIGTKVNATVEDFLVKLYSGDRDATADSEDPASQTALDTAVQHIYRYFDINSAPLAAMDATDMHVFHDGLHYFIVPESAPHVATRLKAMPNVDSNNVYLGSADDRLICMTLYAGVPAFFYRWIEDGEKAYDLDVNAVGLHIDQAGGKTRSGWADLPNLIPESRKRELGLWMDDGRDEKLQKEVSDLMEEAKKYGLVWIEDAPHQYYYRLRLLPMREQSQGDEAAKKEKLDAAIQQITDHIANARVPFLIGTVLVNAWPGMDEALSLVDDLLNHGMLEERELRYSTQTVLPGCPMTESQSSEYKWQLAKKLLRKSLTTTERLKQTVEVIKYLEHRAVQSNEVS